MSSNTWSENKTNECMTIIIIRVMKATSSKLMDAYGYRLVMRSWNI